MKKIVSFVAIILFSLTASSTALIHDYSATGWTTSTGVDWHRGIAEKVQKTSYGYKLSCRGPDGICFQIFGPDLYIYGDLGVTTGGDIDIFRK